MISFQKESFLLQERYFINTKFLTDNILGTNFLNSQIQRKYFTYRYKIFAYEV